MAQPAPKTVADVTRNHLDVVPKFSGEPTTLPIFLSACEYLINTFANVAEPTAPINEYLLRVIISKLEGKALTLIGSREEVRQWGVLKNMLQNYFGDQRDEKCLARDLQDLRAHKTESPYNFGTRVQDVRGLLLTKVKLTEENVVTLVEKIKIYDDMTLQTYLRGLSDQTRLMVRSQQPKSLEEAMSMVIEEENFHYSLKKDNHINDHRNYKPPMKMTPSTPNIQRNFYPQFTPQNLQRNFHPQFAQTRNPIPFNPQPRWNPNNQQNGNLQQQRNPFFNPRSQLIAPPKFSVPQRYTAPKPVQNNQPEPMDTTSAFSRRSNTNQNQQRKWTSQELFHQNVNNEHERQDYPTENTEIYEDYEDDEIQREEEVYANQIPEMYYEQGNFYETPQPGDNR